MTTKKKAAKKGSFENPVVISDPNDPRIKPDWSRDCQVCGSRPILPLTGMCGPCTFGESDTAGGNW